LLKQSDILPFDSSSFIKVQFVVEILKEYDLAKCKDFEN
jgi:hypothetical protein